MEIGFEGVAVTIDGRTLVSDAAGQISFTELGFNSYTVSAAALCGTKLSYNTQISFSPENNIINEVITVLPLNLDIASGTDGAAPTFSITKNGEIFTVSNIKTLDKAGSYVISLHLPGVAGSCGYKEKKNYISGDLVLIVNNDSSVQNVTYSANFDYMNNGNLNEIVVQSAQFSNALYAASLTDNGFSMG